MLLLDVSQAHWYTQATRDVYLWLFAEDPKGNDTTVCGKLLRTMYGTLDAAQRWSDHYTKIIVDAEFTKGIASPGHLYNPTRNIYLFTCSRR